MKFTVIDLIRQRPYLTPRLLPICDHLIWRRLRHVPILSDVLKEGLPPNPPVGKPRGEKNSSRGFKLECALEAIRLNIIDELERRERNGSYMGGVYRKGLR